MKFRVTMKDPDTLHDAVAAAIQEDMKVSAKDLRNNKEKDAIYSLRIEEEYEKASKWFLYGEYLTVEIDTEANTIVVVKTE